MLRHDDTKTWIWINIKTKNEDFPKKIPQNITSLKDGLPQTYAPKTSFHNNKGVNKHIPHKEQPNLSKNMFPSKYHI
jgi:hypothetical protein